MWGFHLVVVLVVWSAWWMFGGARAIGAILDHGNISLTMIGGSLIGGGTSEGGGAVAFPVFTKLFAIPAPEARTFTYMIQSVGMGAASACILAMRVPIERRALILGAPPGIAGVVLGVVAVAPAVPATAVRLYFSVVLSALGIALVVDHLRGATGRRPGIPATGVLESTTLVLAGFAGGMLSGLVGVGENTVVFVVLVLLFRVSEKIATPTTVVLMAVVSMAAAASHLLVLRDVPPVVVDRWLAAVPVVVVFAPLGAFLCARLPVAAVRWILVVLIGADLVSTALLVPLTVTSALTAGFVLAAVTTGFLLMARSQRYAVRAPNDPAAASPRGPAGASRRT